MKKLFLLALVAMLAGNSFAQTETQTEPQTATVTLTPHFTDASKKITVPRYAQIYPEIHDGCVAIYADGKIIIVKDGEVIFGTDFNFSAGNGQQPYFSGGAMVGWRRLTPDSYSSSPFILYPDGTYRDFKWGLKRPNTMSYDIWAISEFVEGYALIRRGSAMFSTQIFIDKNGKEVFPALKSDHTGTLGDMRVYPVRENRRLYYNAELEKYGYADANGNIVIKPQFEKARNFSDGMAAVKIAVSGQLKWGFIDAAGKLVVPATYTLEPGRFTEGLAPVRIGQMEYDFVMNYIDKTGKRLLPESMPRQFNEFHDGYAWVGAGCDKIYVMDREFVETRDMTRDFYYHGNGTTCSFSPQPEGVDKPWGFDFPNGMQALWQRGQAAGDIFAPDGTKLFTAVSKDRGEKVFLEAPTEGDLMFCQVRFENEPQLGGKDTYLKCFINTAGEIVYYFVEGYEGWEGPTPVAVK